MHEKMPNSRRAPRVSAPINRHTDAEKHIIDLTRELFLEFRKLNNHHPSEIHDVANAIHRIQDIIAMRLARRVEPTIWKTYV